MKQKLSLMAVTVLIFIVYSDVVFDSKLISYDDHIGILPMELVHSVEGYFGLRNTYSIIDILPLRDFSAWVDFKISKFLEWNVFHLHNLLLWYGCLYFLFKILEWYSISFPLNILLVAYCGTHPVAVNSVAWVTARKHLLVAFFTIMATYFWLRAVHEKSKQSSTRAVISYFIAIISHPIVGFWPLWAAYLLWTEKRKEKFLKISMALFACFALVVLALNNAYYQSEGFIKATGAPKLQEDSWFLLFSRILVVGRYYLQLLIPAFPSVITYGERQIQNFAGLALLVPSLIFMLGTRFYKTFYFWLFFILVLILSVTLRPSNIIGMDTYILTPLLGWTVLVGILLNSIAHSPLRQKIIIGCLIFIIAIFSVFSKKQVSLWKDEEALWKIAVEREPTATNMIFYAGMLLTRRDPRGIREAMNLALKAKELAPYHSRLGLVLCKSIFYNKYLSLQERAAMLEKHALFDPWYVYCWAAFRAQHGRPAEGQQMIKTMWTRAPKEFIEVFASKVSLVASDWYVMCKSAGASDCASDFYSVKSQTPTYLWDEETANGTFQAAGLPYPSP